MTVLAAASATLGGWVGGEEAVEARKSAERTRRGDRCAKTSHASLKFSDHDHGDASAKPCVLVYLHTVSFFSVQQREREK